MSRVVGCGFRVVKCVLCCAIGHIRRRDKCVANYTTHSVANHTKSHLPQGALGGSWICRNLFGGSLVEGEELAELHLDEVDELRVIDSVALIKEANHGGYTDLARKQGA